MLYLLRLLHSWSHNLKSNKVSIRSRPVVLTVSQRRGTILRVHGIMLALGNQHFHRVPFSKVCLSCSLVTAQN